MLDPSPTDTVAFCIAWMLIESAMPIIIPNRLWAGMAMAVVGLGFLASALGWLPMVSRLQMPSPLPFAVLAILVSVLIALSGEWLRELRLRNTLRKLSIDLNDFAAECGSITIAALRTTTANLADERFQQAKQLQSRFRPIIKSLEPMLLLMPEMMPDPTNALLGTHILNPDVSRIARAAANYLIRTAAELPKPEWWIRRTRIRTQIGIAIIGYLMTFVAIWIILLSVNKWKQ